MKEIELWIKDWVDLFPTGKLVPTDGYLKGTPNDSVKKMQKFCKEYKAYTKDIIFAATKMYLATKKAVGYAYLTRPYYFIHKQEKGSMLAEYCQRIVDGEQMVQPAELNKTYDPVKEFL